MAYRLSENEYYLEPRYDRRQSFYRKAIVEREGGVSKLYSYGTHVATVDMSKKGQERCDIKGFYSDTTTRHIKEFIYQAGLPVGSRQELWEMYTKDGRKEAAEKAAKAELRAAKRAERIQLQAERAVRRAEREQKRQEKLEATKEKLRVSIRKELGDSFTDAEIEQLVLNELA